MIVATGRDEKGYKLDHVEIITRFLDCHVDPFPLKLKGARASSGMICGGESSRHGGTQVVASCWSLSPNGSWRKEPDMKRKRFGFSLTLFQNQALYAIGGTYRSMKHTASQHMKDMADVEMFPVSVPHPRHWVQLESAPFTISHHCAVALKTSLWLIGGSIHRDNLMDNSSIEMKYENNVCNFLFVKLT